MARHSLPLLAFDVAHGTTRLGRARDNDLVLSLPEVAKHHAEMLDMTDRMFVKAIGGESLLVKGRWTTEAVLFPGHRMLVGGYTLQWLGGGFEACLPAAPAGRDGGEAFSTSPIEPEPSTLAAPGTAIQPLVVLVGRDARPETAFDGPALAGSRWVS